LITYARSTGKRIIWSPALLTSYGFSAMQKYAAHVDYLILNKQEANLLTSMDDGVKACSKISNSLNRRNAVVVTLGEEGCVLCTDRNSVVIPPLDLASLSDLEILSTVGAGDTFVGAFGAFKLKGFEDTPALHLANIAAGLKTTRADTRGSPTLEEIKRYTYELDKKTGPL
nr:carbohydrate kinase family protein [Thermoproteota archaeon]